MGLLLNDNVEDVQIPTKRLKIDYNGTLYNVSKVCRITYFGNYLRKVEFWDTKLYLNRKKKSRIFAYKDHRPRGKMKMQTAMCPPSSLSE